MSDLGIDVKALNTTVQQAIAPMFWGVITLAALIPIAAAGGGWVAEKITGWDNKKKKEK